MAALSRSADDRRWEDRSGREVCDVAESPEADRNRFSGERLLPLEEVRAADEKEEEAVPLRLV